MKSKIKDQKSKIDEEKIKETLAREPELLEQFLAFIPTLEKPPIDVIAVTYGPGLPPALWVGINFAKALSLVWDIPLAPIDHMEGHLLVALLRAPEANTLSPITYPPEHTETLRSVRAGNLSPVSFPAIALLISGGHTQLVLMRDWLCYEVIGETRDDAVGEAFDKVARMMGLPYPGGPEISRLAQSSRSSLSSSSPSSPTSYKLPATSFRLPRPMLHSDDYDFSFSGLKTAVLYFLKKQSGESAPFSGDGPRSFDVGQSLQEEIAREFEDAAADVLVAKTKKALEEYGARTLILGGGVSASKEIRRRFTEFVRDAFPETTLALPEPSLSGDNAVMIAFAASIRLARGGRYEVNPPLAADGNLRLS